MARLSFIFLLLVVCIIQTIEFSFCVQNSILHYFKNEREALIEFKDSLSDPSNRISSWVGEDCCSWDGVGCNSKTGHVVKVDLRNPYIYNHMREPEGGIYTKACVVGDELNPELIELKWLSYLDLSGNDFSGSRIPEFIGSFHRLRYLNLSYSHFNGRIPHDLGNLSALNSLDLSSSGLWVDSLHWISHLYSLQYLSMSNVDLSRASDWQYIINGFPSLLELHLSHCWLHEFSPPFSHFNLSYLTVLDLSNNHFKGKIPSYLRNMASLEVLDLFGNSLVSPIPSWLGNFRNLVHLDLGGNNFTGQIEVNLAFENSSTKPVGAADWLAQLKSLKYLSLRSNSFFGPIPESLGTLSALQTLDLSDNELNGSIPENIGKLSELRRLDLSKNCLEGFVSEDHLGELSKLEFLDIGYNSVVLSVVSHWLPPFQLKYLKMSSCKLGPQFPEWLQTQSKLLQLDISNTGITSIPDWFWNQSSSVLEGLNVSHNNIHGHLPTLLSSKSLRQMSVTLSSNRSEGPSAHLSSSLVFIDLHNNSISGSIPNSIGGDMMPLLQYLDLSFNLLSGRIPPSICTMNALVHLDISMNALSGDLPKCWINLQKLEVLNLAYNLLSGAIASSTGHLQSLQILRLSYNNFHGEIPLALKNNTKMYLLDLGENRLSGSIPTWIGENLPDLKILSLRSNMFDGNIPPQLCHLTGLQIMDLADNNLSGVILPCFGDISGMVLGLAESPVAIRYGYEQYEDLLGKMLKERKLVYENALFMLVILDISSNQLNGSIPKELTSLSGLTVLDLSLNQLSGNIPEKIDNWKSLESLDLSKNSLTGTIPQSLSDLAYLSHLNISYNNLSGQIPEGNQLQTFDSSSYEGNANLCGSPLEIKCKYKESSQYTEEEEYDSKLPWFYIGMAVGFITGFWGVFCLLFVNKSWGYLYFRFIDNAANMVYVELLVLKKKLERSQA